MRVLVPPPAMVAGENVHVLSGGTPEEHARDTVAVKPPWGVIVIVCGVAALPAFTVSLAGVAAIWKSGGETTARVNEACWEKPLLLDVTMIA